MFNRKSYFVHRIRLEMDKVESSSTSLAKAGD